MSRRFPRLRGRLPILTRIKLGALLFALSWLVIGSAYLFATARDFTAYVAAVGVVIFGFGSIAVDRMWTVLEGEARRPSARATWAVEDRRRRTLASLSRFTILDVPAYADTVHTCYLRRGIEHGTPHEECPRCIAIWEYLDAQVEGRLDDPERAA